MEQMALNATVEPMLMSDRSVVKTNVMHTALSGMFQPGLTRPINEEKGRPPSRAGKRSIELGTFKPLERKDLPNDQVCRETLANVEIQLDVVLTMMIAIMTDVPPYERVA